MRKGQIAVFVVLGIVIMAAVIAGFMMRKQISEAVFRAEAPEAVTLQQETAEVNAFVDDCLESALKEAALEVIKRGGIMPLTEKNSVEAYNLRAPVYFDEGKESAPLQDEYENTIKKYASVIFLGCTSGFWDFQDEGLAVDETGSITSQLTLASGEARMSVEYPLRLRKGADSAKVQSFSAAVKIDALSPYREAIGLYEEVKAQKMSPAEIAEMVSQKDYTLAVEDSGNARIYALKFASAEDGSPIIFPFAVKQAQKMPEPEEMQDDALKLFLTLPQLFEAEDQPDDFPEQSIADIDTDKLEQIRGDVFA